MANEPRTNAGAAWWTAKSCVAKLVRRKLGQMGYPHHSDRGRGSRVFHEKSLPHAEIAGETGRKMGLGNGRCHRTATGTVDHCFADCRATSCGRCDCYFR